MNAPIGDPNGVDRLVVPRLDPADKALLGALEAEPRASWEDLSRSLGVPRANARARAQRLLDSGAVSVEGVVHPSVFGLDASAHVLVGCTGRAAPVAASIALLPDVPLVSLTAGRRPIIAEVRTHDRTSLAAVLDRVAALDGVRSTESSLYLDILEGANLPPRPIASLTLDALDRHLLTELQSDGRRSFSGLGQQVGLSTGAARARTLRLLESGVVSVRVRLRPGALGETQTGVGIRLSGSRETAVKALLALPAVRYLATSLGRWDVIGTVHVTAGEAEWALLDEVRAVPGVVEVESWRHLRFVKERYDIPAFLD